MSKTFKDFAEACWDSHKQVGTKISSKTGKRVPNCVPKNEDIEDDSPDVVKAVETAKAMAKKRKLEEVSAAMRALRRRAKKTAYAKKTIAKYADAAKRGIPAHKVK